MDKTLATYTKIQKRVSMELTIEQALQQGLAAHKKGSLQEAESLYRAILKAQPAHAEANHNLGVLAVSVNNAGAALTLFKTALETNPRIEQFWLSYIDTLIKEDQREMAKEVLSEGRKIGLVGKKFDVLDSKLKQTVQFIPPSLTDTKHANQRACGLALQNAEIQNNLGNTLKEQGKLEEAKESYLKAITLKSDYAEAYKNLGATLIMLGRFEESESICQQAITLKFDYPEAHNNLGTIMLEQGRLGEAEKSFKQAIVFKSGYVGALTNLSMVYDYKNNLNGAISILKNVLNFDNDDLVLRANVNLAIFEFLAGDFENSQKYLSTSLRIQENLSLILSNERVYHSYLLEILRWHETKSPVPIRRTPNKKLYVIGDSHALVSHQLSVQHSGNNFLCKAFLIMGCKQWHLGNDVRNKFKFKLESVFCSLTAGSDLLLVFGEIDCRLNDGIIPHRKKYLRKDISALITNTVEGYLNYIFKINNYHKHNIIIQGVPCPNFSHPKYPKGILKVQRTELIRLVRDFNMELKNKSNNKGFEFLDVHKLTDNGDGSSNSVWHLDDTHLSPSGMLEAWRLYTA